MNSRQKGARGERELANLLKDYGYDTRRGQQFSGANGDADVVGLPGVHIECKRVEKLNLDAAMEQAKRDAREGEMPVVMHRKDRQGWKVTLQLDDFMKLFTSQVTSSRASFCVKTSSTVIFRLSLYGVFLSAKFSKVSANFFE